MGFKFVQYFYLMRLCPNFQKKFGYFSYLRLMKVKCIQREILKPCPFLGDFLVMPLSVDQLHKTGFTFLFWKCKTLLECLERRCILFY